MAHWQHRAVLSGILGLSLIASACGSSGGGSPSTTNKGTITVAGFNFSESSILAEIYGQALKASGYTINYKLNLGSREVVEPALEKGDINLYPGYAATELEFLNSGKGEATPDPVATVAKLNTYLAPKNLIALTASPAADENAFAVLPATASKYSLKNLSDVAAVGNQIILGGPPECPTRPFCEKGLVSTYGIHFKDFKALDAGGPLTKAALDKGDIQMGLIFSSDGSISAKGYVVLNDDKHLQNADNITPIMSTKAATSDVKTLLNSIDAKLTTADLASMNKQADIDKADPNTIAASWLSSHGFKGSQ